MTGSLQQKKLASGKEYYYIKLTYINRNTGKRSYKTIGTGLEVKNNKRKAEAFKNDCIEKYSFLENVCNNTFDTNILLSDYLDRWLEGKKIDLKTSTYEGYVYRVKRIKDYFDLKHQRLIDITPRDLDQFYKYCLQYGKINQKTHEKELLSVQYWMGHEDAQTTLNIYSHFNKQQLNSSENDLSEISMMASDLFA